MTSPAVPANPAGRPQRVGLEAVALEAGVSVATASRSLSGGAVRPILRLRVEAAASRLGYRPDLAAQAVARGATKSVALIVDYLRSPFGVEITRGVVDAAARHGLVVNVTGAETHPGDLLEMIASARALRPRSIVLATGRVQDPLVQPELIRTLDSYQASGGSVAIVDGLDLPFASCAFNEVAAANALCHALVQLGYRRPIVFNSSAERPDLTSRTAALVEGFHTAGLHRSAITLTELITPVSSELSDDALLSLGDADVVVCVEGTVIPAVYRHIRAQNRLVGIDVGVTAFGQYAIANALRPHLTTVELPLRRAGELALEHALTDKSGTHLSLPGNLRVRASSPRRLGRKPPRTARVARAGAHRDAVGLIIPASGEFDFDAVARELFDLAHQDGRRCAMLTEQSLLQSRAGYEYGALVVFAPLSDALAAHVGDHDVRCVVLDAPSDNRVTQLSVEVAEAMQNLLEHLYALGHTRIVYIGGESGEPVEDQRRWGVELFSATHAGVVVSTHPASGQPSPNPLEEMLQTATAVVSHSDREAARLVRRVIALGYAVPADVSIAGFGGTWAGELSVPEITTVRIPAVETARSIWRLIDRATVSDGPTVSEGRSLAMTLIDRGSTAVARTR